MARLPVVAFRAAGTTSLVVVQNLSAPRTVPSVRRRMLRYHPRVVVLVRFRLPATGLHCTQVTALRIEVVTSPCSQVTSPRAGGCAATPVTVALRYAFGAVLIGTCRSSVVQKGLGAAECRAVRYAWSRHRTPRSRRQCWLGHAEARYCTQKARDCTQKQRQRQTDRHTHTQAEIKCKQPHSWFNLYWSLASRV
eukprot:117550-Rhodomonas_salina.1